MPEVLGKAAPSAFSIFSVIHATSFIMDINAGPASTPDFVPSAVVSSRKRFWSLNSVTSIFRDNLHRMGGLCPLSIAVELCRFLLQVCVPSAQTQA